MHPLWRGISIYYVHLFASFLSVLVMTPVVVKALGPEAYGVWILIGSVIGYSTLLDFGLNTAVAKYTAEYTALGQPGMVNRLASIALVMYGRVAIGLLIAIAMLAATGPSLVGVRDTLVWPVRAGLLLMGCNAVVALVAGAFGNIIYGLQRVDLWKACGLVHVTASALLTAVLLWWGLGLTGIAVASLGATGLLFGSYRFCLRIVGHRFVFSTDGVSREFRREVFLYSGRTVVLGLTSKILYSTDAIVVGLVLGATAVGPYEIAYKICFLMTYLFSVISTSLFPRFSQLYALGDLESTRRLLLRVTWISLAIITPLIVTVAYLGKAFITFWVGLGNFVGWPTLLALLVMGFIHAVGTPVGLMLQAIGKNRIFVYSEAANAALNLGLSLVLIRPYGVVGVALGTLIAHALTSTWVLPLIACRYIKLSVRQYLRESIIPPIVVGPVVGVGVFLVFGTPPDALSPLSIAGHGIAIIAAYALILLIFQRRSESVQVLLKWMSRGVMAES